MPTEFTLGCASLRKAVEAAGPWVSQLPGYEDLTGSVALFLEPVRVKITEDCFGPLSGVHTLDLGSLEGGYSYQLAQRGADVTGIEAHFPSYIRSLVAKEVLGFHARFLLGDFKAYLEEIEERWDLIFASGVLYHMTDPIELLRRLALRTDRLLLWTMYVTPEQTIQWPVEHTVTHPSGHRYYLYYYRERYDRHYSGAEAYCARLQLPAIISTLGALFKNVQVVLIDNEAGHATIVASECI